MKTFKVFQSIIESSQIYLLTENHALDLDAS